MEPDFDKILSNNIRRAELRPVPWNKQAVWRNVQSRTGATRQYKYVWYAAAATLLLLIYFSVGPITKQTKLRVTDVKVKPGQGATESERPSLPEKKQEYALTPSVSHLENSASPPARKVPDIIRKTPEVTVVEIKDADDLIEPVVNDIKIQKEEPFMAGALAVPEQRIKPIVGITTESSSGDVVTTNRKKRLRMLKSPDPMPWEDPGNALVFAVKK